MNKPFGNGTLPPAIRSRHVPDVNGLNIHILEAGYKGAEDKPCVLLLHGFPELAYSWRKVMPALADAGYYVVAPDQRGYGRTTGWDPDYDGDLHSFRLLNLVRDMLGLLTTLGRREIAGVVGHDFGASVAANAALIRPDVFKALVLMSAPYGGPPALSVGAPAEAPDIHAAMAALPRPRKHYQWYYSTREADADMWRCPQGVHDFLRAYFHQKSADWKANKPAPLSDWTAEELAKLPTYYIMDQAQNMAETVAAEMPSADEIAGCAWLTEEELHVYSGEYDRQGFRGGLQWYRCRTDGIQNAELDAFAGRTIDVPSCFISGASDWGVHQVPSALETMRTKACTDMRGVHLIDGAGHWVQQEQYEAVNRLLVEFLASLA